MEIHLCLYTQTPRQFNKILLASNYNLHIYPFLQMFPMDITPLSTKPWQLIFFLNHLIEVYHIYYYKDQMQNPIFNVN